MTGYFIQAFIYLCAAVIAVPLAKRFGLGSVLGYLVAGVVIGPVVGLVGDETETLQHFAEFGVVMMLFLVGLELEPRLLWSMRTRLLGLGGLQVGLTTLAMMGLGLMMGLDWRIALTVGMILALSSTAIVLQTLNEKGLTKTEGGRGAFGLRRTAFGGLNRPRSSPPPLLAQPPAWPAAVWLLPHRRCRGYRRPPDCS